MFSQEFYGYNKNEVDAYIQRMKSSYEARLMEEKLKALDSEKKVLDIKNARVEIENKEKNIMTALNVIEKAKKFQEEGSRNYYRLIMDKLELLVKELTLKYPLLKQEQGFEDILDEFSDMVKEYKTKLEKTTNINQPVYSDNDSMRLLLNKMQDYKKGQESPKEVHITTIKPDESLVVPKEDDVVAFDFDEALHPTEDLEEIMKAFDFYNQ